MFLDEKIANDFRSTINSSQIFRKSEKLKEKFNLICVVMDRISSAVGYLNDHSDFPATEEDFVCFLVYACMVKDAVSKLYENVYHIKPEYIHKKKYFIDVRQYGKIVFTDETQPTDDVFFEYLRSMAFAHPFETTKGRRPRLFMDDDEKQYCPWVIVQGNVVGIRVYTSSDKFVIEDITFPFENLKEYIKTRYEYLKQLTEWAEKEIFAQDEEWAKHKVARSEDVLETIQSIKQIYEERFYETYEVEKIEQFLRCEITVDANIENIKRYKEALKRSVYKLCDALDNVEECDLCSATDEVFALPRVAHSMMRYQLEKIYCYLDDESDYWDRQWGLKQAEAFSKEFAKKWVVFDFDKMTDDEIKLTVAAACYLETKEQEML